LKNSEVIEKEINGIPTATVIWLHGLGADGSDFEPIVPQLKIPVDLGLRFIFPHAPFRSITINNGMTMRAWYDIMSLDRTGVQDEDGIRQSALMVESLIEKENKRGIESERIIIAGFSQGGAIALHSALRCPQRLGGLLALSTYLPLEFTLKNDVIENEKSQSRELPIFLAHGQYDPVIQFNLGVQTRIMLEEMKYSVLWNEYPMDHAVCQDEIKDIGLWISKILMS
jgi:phospholipase/carboxylesterase|tara:strand:+ start:513 stop:1193 length:681 start_codon:yes stop_codon:yes gene_type:complete